MGIRDALTHEITPRVALVVITLAMCTLWVWAFGKAPIAAEQDGFVMRIHLASDVQTIVGKDIDELKKQSNDTSRKVDNIKVALDQILADYYSKRIKDATRQRCKLPPAETGERDRLWDQISQDVSLYKVYSGDSGYQRPTCSDV